MIQKGVYMLDDRYAEDILVGFRAELDSSINKVFNRVERAKLETLGKAKEYEEFYEELKFIENMIFRDKFRDWLEKTDTKVLEMIAAKSMWFYEIFYFEINSIFEKWYKSKPDLSMISPELRDFIKGGYKDASYMKLSDTKKEDIDKLYNSYDKRLKKFKKKIFRILSIYR